MRELLQRLGLASYGGNYDSVRRRLDRLGCLDPRFLPLADRRPRARLEASDHELRAAVEGATTKAEILRRLGHQVLDGLYPQLDRRLREAGIETTQLLGMGWSRGQPRPARTPLSDLLVRGSSTGSDGLRRRLLREGVFEHRCACCGLTEWQGEPIPLELDHIDGDRSNNLLENLRLLCPNCHARTDTYRGRNVGRPHSAAEVVVLDVRELALARLRAMVAAA